MREIPLTQNKVALVDDADYEFLMQWKWSYHVTKTTGGGYAKRGYQISWDRVTDKRKTKTVLMHIQLLGKREGFEIDHIDRNGCNNQRDNLQFITHAQNLHNCRKARNNTSGYRGVMYSANNDKHGWKCWRSEIQIHGKGIYIGLFSTAIEAAKAYDAKAREHFGELAATNFKL